MFKIVKRGDLAGGVARQRKRQFFGGDANAVVSNPDQAHAAFFQLDLDARRAGIERVLQQFLHHGRRTLDDFAGCDLVDQGVRELLDGHGGITAARPS